VTGSSPPPRGTAPPPPGNGSPALSEEAAARLEAYRREIDAIDDELLARFNRRAALAVAIARVKDDGGAGADYYRPDREAEVRRRMIAANPGPLPEGDVAHLYQELMSACRALERAPAVAFLGPEGSFTEAALVRQFGHRVEARPLESLAAVFREVEAGGCDYGVVPMEDSTEGVASHALDLCASSPLLVCGEVELRGHQCLMSDGTPPAGLTRLYAQPRSLARCRRWLDAHLAGVPRELVGSNAEAARKARAEPGAAALGGSLAATRHGLEIVAESIEDEPDALTRFLVIGRQATRPTGDDKTAVVFAFRDQPGSLHEMLGILARRGVSLSRIESRPARGGLWPHQFFVDLEGHADDPQVAAALAELAGRAGLLKRLGSYPRCRPGG
jgi:chorismate mutase / prephenate dehydratase